MQPADEYALMEWLNFTALKAHNDCEGIRHAASKLLTKDKVSITQTHFDAIVNKMKLLEQREKDFDEVITHIQNGRVNQRPHVKERI